MTRRLRPSSRNSTTSSRTIATRCRCEFGCCVASAPSSAARRRRRHRLGRRRRKSGIGGERRAPAGAQGELTSPARKGAESCATASSTPAGASPNLTCRAGESGSCVPACMSWCRAMARALRAFPLEIIPSGGYPWWWRAMKRYLLTVIFLAGCAPIAWDKPGAAQSEFNTCDQCIRSRTGNCHDQCMPPSLASPTQSEFNTCDQCIRSRTGNCHDQCMPPSLASPGTPSGASGVPIATEMPQDEVHLQLYNGIFAVPVVINGAISIPFVLDSGAADVQLPADVVLTLVRSGTLSEGDFIGESSYILANGSTLRSARFNIRELRVGDHVVRNVAASVGSVSSDALLGQSFLSRLPSWTLDNRRHVLVLAR